MLRALKDSKMPIRIYIRIGYFFMLGGVLARRYSQKATEICPAK